MNRDWVEGWAWPVIERGEVSSFSALVLLRLAAHANRDGVAWPSGRRLAAMVGRSDDRRVRAALAELRDLGLIDGEPAVRRVTRWRLVEDENEQRRVRRLRARSSQDQLPASAATGAADDSRASAARLPPICRTTAAHLPQRGAAEVEVEVEVEELPLSLSTEAKDEGEKERVEINFDPRNLVQFKRMGPA